MAPSGAPGLRLQCPGLSTCVHPPPHLFHICQRVGLSSLPYITEEASYSNTRIYRLTPKRLSATICPFTPGVISRWNSSLTKKTGKQTHGNRLHDPQANHLRIKVHAFIRRSDYKNTWGSFEERQLGKLCNANDNTTPDGEWCRDWASMAKERKSTNDMFEFTYQTMGASNPVISGDTPVGVPGGWFELLPK